MKAKVVVTLDGQVSVFVEEGTFDEGKLAIARLLKELESQGLNFESVGEVEQHRHEAQRVEVKSRERGQSP